MQEYCSAHTNKILSLVFCRIFVRGFIKSGATFVRFVVVIALCVEQVPYATELPTVSAAVTYTKYRSMNRDAAGLSGRKTNHCITACKHRS